MQPPTKQDFSDEVKRIFELATKANDKLDQGCTLDEFFAEINAIEYSCRLCREMLVAHSKFSGTPITLKGNLDRRHFKSSS